MLGGMRGRRYTHVAWCIVQQIMHQFIHECPKTVSGSNRILKAVLVASTLDKFAEGQLYFLSR